MPKETEILIMNIAPPPPPSIGEREFARGAFGSWFDRKRHATLAYFLDKLRYCPGALFLYFYFKCGNSILRRYLLDLKLSNLLLKFQVLRLEFSYMLTDRRISRLEKRLKIGRFAHGYTVPNYIFN